MYGVKCLLNGGERKAALRTVRNAGESDQQQKSNARGVARGSDKILAGKPESESRHVDEKRKRIAAAVAASAPDGVNG